MADQNSYRRANNCGPSQRPNPPSREVNPWDNEPTWPGAEYDDDEAVADGMSDDDDDDQSSAWRLDALAFQQTSPWDEAVARLSTCKYRTGSA
jgi:hypothetical protein